MLWTSAVAMLLLAVWLRASPGGWFDVRGALVYPIYALAVLGIALGIARVVVHGRGVVTLAGALALFAFAVGVVWPDDGYVTPWPWTLLG